MVVVVRQQAITWVNIDPDPCRYMASPGHNVLRNFIHKIPVNDDKSLRMIMVIIWCNGVRNKMDKIMGK